MMLLFVFLSILACSQGQNPIGLRAASNLRGILFGAYVNYDNIRNNVDNGQYIQSIVDNYRVIGLENELKYQHIWVAEDVYDFAAADYLLGAPNETGWAQQNLMQVRGHNVIWPPDTWTPAWLLKEESSITSDKAKQLLSDYIHTVVGRYRGKIPWWDVINEAIHDINTSNPFNLRDCFWLRKLGPNYLKYAFIFSHEADPDAKLYYNEYGTETVGIKATSTLNLVQWLRSEGATVHGVGFQWHINSSTTVIPGDGHYQSAQQFIDNGFHIKVTELDVAVPTTGAYPVNPDDIQTQGVIFQSILDFVLHFTPNCDGMLTWGFTDRYSWIPTANNYTKGDGLPLDWLYLPKPAYWQMQEVMTRVVDDGIYRLSPQSQPDKCLGLSENTTSNQVQLYNDSCSNAYEKWNITWQGDGTYRFSSLTDNNRVLAAYNTTATVGGVEIVTWSNDVNEDWAFSSQGNNTYRIVPRTAWWRVLTVYNISNDIGIVDPNTAPLHDWILNKV